MAKKYNSFDDWLKGTNAMGTAKAPTQGKSTKASSSSVTNSKNMSYVNSKDSTAKSKFSQRKKSEDGASYEWQGLLLKDVPKSKGKSYAKKFDNLMSDIGVKDAERKKEFKTWLDAKEVGAKSRGQRITENNYATQMASQKMEREDTTRILNNKRKADMERVKKEADARNKKDEDKGFLSSLASGAKKGWNEASRFMNNVNNMATFGFFEGREKKLAEDVAKRTGDDTLLKHYEKMYSNEGRGTAGKVADFASKGAGMMASGAGIARGLQLLGLGTKAGAGLGSNALRMAGQGAVAGGGDQAMRSLIAQTANKDLAQNQNRTWGDEAKDIALGTAFGAVLDPLLTVGPQALKEGARSLRGVADDAVGNNDIMRQLTEMTTRTGPSGNSSLDALEALRGARPSQGATPMTARPSDPVAPPVQTATPSPLRQQLDQLDAEIARNPNDISLQQQREEIVTELQFEDLLARGNTPTTPSPVQAEAPAPTTTPRPTANNTEIDKAIAKIDRQLKKTPNNMKLRDARMQLEARKQLDSVATEVPQVTRDAQPPVEQSVTAPDSPPSVGNTDILGALRSPTPSRTMEPSTTPYKSFIDNSVPEPKVDPKTGMAKMSKHYVNDLAEVEQVDKAVRQLEGASDVIDYNKPRTLLQKVLGREGKVKDANVKVESSLGKSLNVIGKNAHSQASQVTESRWGDFAKRLEEDDVIPQELWDYASARHADAIMTKQKAGGMEWAQAMDELETNPNLTQAETDELNEIIRSYKDYTLPADATPENIQAMLKIGDNPKVQQYYQEFQELQRQKLHDMYKSGMLNKQAYDEMLKNDTYISMARNFGEDTGVTGLGKGRQASNPILGMKRGSEESIKNPFTEAIRQTYVTEFNIRKNNALKPIEKYAQIPESGFRKIGGKEDLRGKNVVEVWSNGNPVQYEVPPAVENYVKNMMSAESDPELLTNMIQKIANVQRKLTTQYSPAFQLKSLIREPIQSALVSRTNHGVLDGLRTTAVGYVDAIAGPQLERATSGLPKALQFKSFKETWKGMGGNQFQYMDMADEHLKKSARELMDTGKINGSNTIKPVAWLGKFGELVESGPRLGEFRSAKGQGYSDLDALYEAVDLTNYKRGGTKAREANKYVPYLNATIQGNDRVIRAFKEAPLKTTARGVGALTTVSSLAYMTRFHDGVSEDQRQELQNLQDYQKNSYIFIPNFWDETNNDIYAIPKPFALGQMFMNPAERLLDDYYNQTASDPKAKDHVINAFKDTARSFMPPVMPALVGPMAEAYFNHQVFSGMPIESNTDIPKEEREAYNQSMVTKWVADMINGISQVDGGLISPADLDYVVKQSVGSIGSNAISMTDGMAENEPMTRNNPVTNPLAQFRLDQTTSGRGYQDITKLEEQEDTGALVRAISGDHEDTSVRNLNKEDKEYFKKQTNYYNLLAEYKDLNKAVNEARKDTELDGDAKRRKVEQLRKQQDDIYSEAVDYFNRLNK